MLLSVIAVLLWAIDLIIAFEQRLRSWNKAMASLNETGISCDSYRNFWSRNNFATATITMRQSPSRTSDQAHTGINHCNPQKVCLLWRPPDWPQLTRFPVQEENHLASTFGRRRPWSNFSRISGIFAEENRCYSIPFALVTMIEANHWRWPQFLIKSDQIKLLRFLDSWSFLVSHIPQYHPIPILQLGHAGP
jgi:hypothetical protein